MKFLRIFILVALLVTLTGCGTEKSQNNDIQTNNDISTEATDTEDNTTNNNTNSSEKITNNNTKKESTTNKVNSNKNNSNNNNNTAINKSSENNPTEVQNEESFYRQWVIEKAVGYSKVGTYSDDDIKKIVGKKLSFSKEQSSCFGDDASYLNDTVKNPTYKKSVITSDEFLSTWLVPLSTLSINSDTVTEIEVNDSKNLPACTFFIKDNDTLILYGGGTFFELRKA
ncbi:hypothetical protein FDB15_16625 [Clostridium botulinum]|uniref:hypothetical protein n=1 Tax=unclassified Clostridium TaxID=2614128 RepID=UPI00068FF23D|nr:MULTISPECIES: hypothetical protein [unclassified Clostridium]MBY6780422.1 hypothetical protein [Clostridium botulinum]MBY6853629.1 hypothetical protein [Clostridium botulinum]MBY7009201.1 hypothetical protein [Clostridium botulinum]NFF24580.1 hypothetical protein [Clostridium botulinum]NFF36791.1 hypothetical protein [Clostridium botulinum]